MAQVVFDGTITVGPTTSGSSTFPATVATVPVAASPNPKPAMVYASDVTAVQSPSAYVTLSSLGATSTVTKANFLYVKTNGPFQVRLSFANDPGPAITSVLYVTGSMVIEASDTHPIVLLEAQGSGSIEYIVSGNQ